MIDSLKKSFNVCSKQPFLFVWSSLLFIVLFLLFILAAVGIFLMYFLFLSVFGQELNFESLATLAVLGMIVLLLSFFANGINASLAMAYHEATKKRKVSLTKFYSYALDRAPTMFGLSLVRELIWLLLVGPFIALYIYFLEGYEYMDILLWMYGLFMTFVIHMFFTPSFLLAGAFGTSMFGSLKQGLEFLRVRHVFFIGLYMLFALIWIFNFIPFIQIATWFFIYPLAYTAMILMIKNTIKVSIDEEVD